MIKVSIIEDQPQILRSLRDKIQSYSKEICIVSEFLNGRDAILSIKTNPPDIVFTDIRMPQLDGLKMISILKKEHPNILFVIISGFGEFEYTHEAIKLGVTEYLLKPVKNEDLYAILRKLIKQVEISKYLRERAALYSAINNQQKQLENYHSFLKCAKYDAFLINFGHYIMSISDVSDSINALLFDSDLKAALKKIIPNYSKIWTFKGKHLNELYLIIGNKNDKNIIDPQSLLHLLKDLFEPVTYSCKLNISEPKFFYTAFNNMRLLVRKNLVFCRSSFLNQDKEHTIQANTIDASFETRIIRSLETLDKNSFFNIIHELLKKTDKLNYTQYNLNIILLQILLLCQKKSLVSNEPIKDLSIQIIEVLTTSYTYESLYLGLHPIFDSFFENLSELSIYGETTLLAAKVKDYINRNFANKISIRDISDIFHIHPAHLSRLFKKNFGVSPMAYLTSVKIENAKELIRTTDMLLKDIAEKVGYTDPFYFSRMFKSITGSSPLEFRNKYN